MAVKECDQITDLRDLTIGTGALGRRSARKPARLQLSSCLLHSFHTARKQYPRVTRHRWTARAVCSMTDRPVLPETDGNKAMS